MGSRASPPLPVHDCLVLSGGGAKAAYGAGVAKAIAAYKKKKKIDRPLCYVGTSAGALNAYLLAAHNPDTLRDFWLSVDNRSVLGVHIRNAKFQGTRRWLAGLFHRGRPFSIYANDSLAILIRNSARLSDVKSPLVIAATDYLEGKLKTFYTSRLIEKMVKQDGELPEEQRRLGHWRLIDSDEILVEALLASAAIPTFFPPVQITLKSSDETSWYIDGGIGNNTPTREAAYFLRYLNKLKLGESGTVYCVLQDPPRILEEGERFAFSDIVKRTLDVYHYVHMEPIVGAWERINREVRDHNKREETLTAWIRQQSLPKAVKKTLVKGLKERLGTLGGASERVAVPMVQIRPQTTLGDSLDFDPRRAKENIERGYHDALRALKDAVDLPSEDRLSETEYRALANSRIFRRPK